MLKQVFSQVVIFAVFVLSLSVASSSFKFRHKSLINVLISWQESESESFPKQFLSFVQLLSLSLLM